MSKIGKKPISIQDSVTVTVTGDKVQVSGPKGELTLNIPSSVEVKFEDNQIVVTSKESNMWGLIRSLLNNIVIGVTTGWTKTLEISGTGYRANTTGSELNLSLGFSHPWLSKLQLALNLKFWKTK